MAALRLEEFLGSKRLLGISLGMAGGPGECRVIECTAQRTRRLGKFSLAWWERKKGRGQWYPLAPLKAFWTTPRPALFNLSLCDMILRPSENTAGACITMWGADLAALARGYDLLGAENYLSAYDTPGVKDRVEGLDAETWHVDFDGAAQAPYQPYGQLATMVIDAPDVLSNAVAVVPVADYLTYLLTGQMGHDSGMAQSMGLREMGPARLQRDFSDWLKPGALCPWKRFDSNTVLQVGTPPVYISPCTHDSTKARELAFGCGEDNIVWTGSWNGQARRRGDSRPNATTCRLGLSFEGDPAAMQQNAAMFGSAFKLLVQQMGITHDSASETVLAVDNVPLLLPEEVAAFPTSGAAALTYLAEKLGKKGSSASRENMLSCLVRSAAKAALDGMNRLAEAAGKPINQFAVVGGWSENRAFTKLLGARGAKVIIPPHARDATDIGALADLIRRMALAQGRKVDVPEILEQIPPLEDA